MKNVTIRPLPKEKDYATWPTLEPTSQDLQWVTVPLPLSTLRQRLNRHANYLRRKDALESIPKGLIIGIICFSAIYGILPFIVPSLYNWHWLWVILGIIASISLVGTEVTSLLAIIIALWFSRSDILTHPIQLGICLLSGIFVRVILEIFL